MYISKMNHRVRQHGGNPTTIAVLNFNQHKGDYHDVTIDDQITITQLIRHIQSIPVFEMSHLGEGHYRVIGVDDQNAGHEFMNHHFTVGEYCQQFKAKKIFIIQKLHGTPSSDEYGQLHKFNIKDPVVRNGLENCLKHPILMTHLHAGEYIIGVIYSKSTPSEPDKSCNMQYGMPFREPIQTAVIITNYGSILTIKDGQMSCLIGQRQLANEQIDLVKFAVDSNVLRYCTNVGSDIEAVNCEQYSYSKQSGDTNYWVVYHTGTQKVITVPSSTACTMLKTVQYINIYVPIDTTNKEKGFNTEPEGLMSLTQFYLFLHKLN
jgi:hypothetical protein